MWARRIVPGQPSHLMLKAHPWPRVNSSVVKIQIALIYTS